MTTTTVERVKNLVAGQWQESEGKDFSKAHNPSQGKIIAQVPHSTRQEMSIILSKAQEAQKDWGVNLWWRGDIFTSVCIAACFQTDVFIFLRHLKLGVGNQL